jgi:geranylgeranyl diphosphate synthase, type I
VAKGFDLAEFRSDVQVVLDTFCQAKAQSLAALGADLEPLLAEATKAITGGKRFRAMFCYWGFQALWPEPPTAVVAQLLQACAGLEVLHASALVHDDLMDASDLRRGRPAAHVSFMQGHKQLGFHSDSAAYGAAGAILLGDLLQGWAEELIRGCGLVGTLAGLEMFDICRNEVIAGQFLDVTAQARGYADVDAAMRVLRFKSAKYSIERPIQIGATLSGRCNKGILAELSAFGLPLGEAFQLRDDLLGVFGDPSVTGKPAGDDLSEGKRTVLVALTLDAAPPAEAKFLNNKLGSPLTDAEVKELQQIIDQSGAKAQVEHVIQELFERALDALTRAEISPNAREALGLLAQAATHRQL